MRPLTDFQTEPQTNSGTTGGVTSKNNIYQLGLVWCKHIALYIAWPSLNDADTRISTSRTSPPELLGVSGWKKGVQKPPKETMTTKAKLGSPSKLHLPQRSEYLGGHDWLLQGDLCGISFPRSLHRGDRRHFGWHSASTALSLIFHALVRMRCIQIVSVTTPPPPPPPPPPSPTPTTPPNTNHRVSPPPPPPRRHPSNLREW